MKHVAGHHLVQLFNNNIKQRSLTTPFRPVGNLTTIFSMSISDRMSKIISSLGKL